VANVLSRLGYDPVWQDIFGTEPGDLRQMLRDKIDDCDGLIHLVGHGYGAEPPELDPDFGRISYTQFEFLHARKQGKKTWIILAEDGCTCDTPLGQLDLPADPAHPYPTGYQAERRVLQDAWRRRLKDECDLWHEATSDTKAGTEGRTVEGRIRGAAEEIRRLAAERHANAVSIKTSNGTFVGDRVDRIGSACHRRKGVVFPRCTH